MQVQYRIYPSLLNAFQRYLDSDRYADSFLNTDRETGEPRQTADEVAAQREQDLLDLINRVPHEPIEAADRGTAFNEVVDCLVLNMPCEREDITIKTVSLGEPDVVEAMGETHVGDPLKAIRAEINGFAFLFDVQTCKDAAKYYANAVPQHYCEAVLPTRYGKVLLYGYADYIFPNKVADMKTTKSYTFGNYEDGWQKDLYPYCLIESGEMTEVQSFEYTVFQWRGGTSRTPLLSAEMYKEEYTYNHEKATARLRGMCERLIEWLEMHRNEITNTKIFDA